MRAFHTAHRYGGRPAAKPSRALQRHQYTVISVFLNRLSCEVAHQRVSSTKVLTTKHGPALGCQTVRSRMIQRQRVALVSALLAVRIPSAGRSISSVALRMSSSSSPSASASAFKYPSARRSDHQDTYASKKHGQIKVPDPYRSAGKVLATVLDIETDGYR